MDKEFWHQRWRNQEIGFHNSEYHPLLLQHFSSLSLKPGKRIFIPLCGKTLDIKYMLQQGYRVCGIELVESAVQELFKELGAVYEVTAAGKLNKYSAEHIDIFAGDIFDLSQDILGPVDAVYDRAAMVALPESMRDNYISHVSQITNMAQQLLITFEYDTSVMSGPPFSHTQNDIEQYYQHFKQIELLTREELQEGLKGNAATEFAWLISNNE